MLFLMTSSELRGNGKHPCNYVVICCQVDKNNVHFCRHRVMHYFLVCFRDRRHHAILITTLLLQLHFSSFPDALLVRYEVPRAEDRTTLSMLVNMTASSTRCTIASDREGVEVQLQQQSCVWNCIVHGAEP